jgi:hypothetical protein
MSDQNGAERFWWTVIGCGGTILVVLAVGVTLAMVTLAKGCN